MNSSPSTPKPFRATRAFLRDRQADARLAELAATLGSAELSRSELAALLGVSPSWLAEIEESAARKIRAALRPADVAGARPINPQLLAA